MGGPDCLVPSDGEQQQKPAVQHSFRPAAEMEILTPAQLAGLLQVDEDVVIELAEQRELPGRKVGEEWRFSREAILAWLAEEE